MIRLVRFGRIELSTGARPAEDPGADASGAPRARRLSVADKAALAILAVGLLAIGGVLLVAGIALLAGLAAVGSVVGAGVLIRHRLRRHGSPILGPGEVAGHGTVTAPARPAGTLSAPPDDTSRPR